MTDYAKWSKYSQALEEEKIEQPPVSQRPRGPGLEVWKRQLHEHQTTQATLDKQIQEYEHLLVAMDDIKTKTNQMINVPLGKKACIPGKVVDGEKILAHMGDDYYLDTTATKAKDMAQRNLKHLKEQSKKEKKTIEELQEKLGQVDALLNLKKEFEAAGIQDIREPYNEEEDKKEKVKSQPEPMDDEDVAYYFELEEKERVEQEKNQGDWDDILARMEKLEAAEEEASSTARERLTSKIESKPAVETSDSLKEQGNAAFSKKQYKKAEALYTQAIELDEESAVLHCNRSACRFRLNDYKNSFEDASIATKLDPSWAKGHYRKAMALQALDRLEECAQSMERAVELKPEDASLGKQAREMRAKVAKSIQKTPSPQEAPPTVVETRKAPVAFTNKILERNPTIETKQDTQEAVEQPKRPVSRFKARRTLEKN